MCGEEIRLPANWLTKKYVADGSEAPDNSSGSPVIVLVGAVIVTVHVIALQPPGEVLEGKLIVRAAANVDRDRVVDEAVGVHVPNASHGVHEGAPFSKADGKAWAGEEVVLLNAAAIEAAAIDHQSEARKAGKGERLKRGVPSAITLLVDDIGELGVGNPSVDVSTGKKSVKLCRHRDREQHETNKRQRCGSRL
jgi:hypothetical protein